MIRDPALVKEEHITIDVKEQTITLHVEITDLTLYSYFKKLWRESDYYINFQFPFRQVNDMWNQVVISLLANWKIINADKLYVHDSR